jgi:DNA repair exonuclease SbcCD ATPase subunit
MFKIKDLTVKNFMSVGNATQAVNFDRKDLTLVLGENLDLGGDDSGARNGTGKTTIINALSYALYGNALTNIKKDNLINKTNTNGMMVTIDFEVGGESYRIWAWVCISGNNSITKSTGASITQTANRITCWCYSTFKIIKSRLKKAIF